MAQLHDPLISLLKSTTVFYELSEEQNSVHDNFCLLLVQFTTWNNVNVWIGHTFVLVCNKHTLKPI